MISLTTNLIPPYILSFHVVHEGFVAYPVAAGRGIVAGKIPIAQVGRTCLVERFDGLVDHGNRDVDICGGNEPCNFIRDLGKRKGFIDLLYNILCMQLVVSLQFFASVQ